MYKPLWVATAPYSAVARTDRRHGLPVPCLFSRTVHLLSCLCNMRFPNWQHDPGAAAAAPASDSTGARLAPRTAHSFSRPGACIIICHIHMCVCLADLWLAKFVKQIEKMQKQEPGAAGRRGALGRHPIKKLCCTKDEKPPHGMGMPGEQRRLCKWPTTCAPLNLLNCHQGVSGTEGVQPAAGGGGRGPRRLLHKCPLSRPLLHTPLSPFTRVSASGSGWRCGGRFVFML